MSRLADKDLKHYDAQLHTYPYRRLTWLERHEDAILNIITWVVFLFVMWILS